MGSQGGSGVNPGIMTLWSACDRGETEVVRHLLGAGRDVNARNCLGCTPLLYACGSGHLETVMQKFFMTHDANSILSYSWFCRCALLQVRVLLGQIDLDINRRNNDRLTSFMLAMQSNNVISASNQATGPPATNSTPAMSSSSGANPQTRPENAQDKLRRLMVGGAVSDLTGLALRYLGR